jgi:hypothetical protein
VTPRRPRARSSAAEALRRARTCYDHLAGELGVQVAGSSTPWVVRPNNGALPQSCNHGLPSDEAMLIKGSGQDRAERGKFKSALQTRKRLKKFSILARSEDIPPGPGSFYRR